MTDNYERRTLTEESIDFIRDSLKYTSIYSKDLEEKFRKSNKWTIVPKNISEKELYEFKYGGKVVHDPRSLVSEIVFEKLTKDESNVWIIEDNVSHPDYSIDNNKIEDVTLPFNHNRSIFQFIIKKPISINSILKTFMFGGAYPFVGFITKINNDIEKDIFINKLTEEDLDIIRTNITFFVIGAYDEESYIFIDLNA